MRARTHVGAAGAICSSIGQCARWAISVAPHASAGEARLTGENGRPLCGAEIAMSKDGFGSTSGVGRQGVTVGYAADSSRTPGDDPSSGLAVGAEDACRPQPDARR